MVQKKAVKRVTKKSMKKADVYINAVSVVSLLRLMRFVGVSMPATSFAAKSR